MSDLKETLALLREQGVSGPVEINGIKFTIPTPEVKQDPAERRKSRQKEYDTLLFAATEGIPDEEVET